MFKMKWPRLFFIFFAIVLVVGVESSQLSDLNDLLGPQCGQKLCKFLEYCSEFTLTCQPCSQICNKSSHNFDKSVCQKNCQDYLKEQYFERSGAPSENNTLAIIAIVLTLFLYVIFTIYFCHKFIHHHRNENFSLSSIRQRFFKKDKKSSTADLDKTPNNMKAAMKKPAELRIEIGNPALRNSSSDDSPYTISTNLSRKPAEDSALDYAYENHAMSTATPSPR